MKNEFNFDESNSKLNDLSVEWIDKELLEYILKSLSNMSKRQFNRFIRDSNDWVSKIGKVNQVYPVKYPNIRQAADFLAIPPWLLFYRANKGDFTGDLNNQIIRMFQKIPPNLPIFEVTWANNRKASIKSYSMLGNENIDSYISGNLGSDELSQHTHLKGKWKDIQEFLIERLRKKSFSAAATIYSEEYSRYTLLGTLRIKSEKHLSIIASEVKKYGTESFWSTAWFSLDLHVDEIELHKRYIDDITKNISYLIGSFPWKFSIQHDDKIIQLYSWHSLRDIETEGLEIEVSSIINNKLKKAKYPLELGVANRIIDLQIKEFKNNEANFIDFNNFIEDCFILDKNKSINYRRANTINYLFDCGYIKEGDILELRYNVTLNGSIGEDVLTARVSLFDNSPKIIWLKDNNFYSVTGLTKKIFNEFEIVANLKSHNGNNYWGLVSDNQCLLHKIKTLLKID